MKLNTEGEELGKYMAVHAMTDVTGFGLLGHLIEMCEGSGLSAEINFKDIPLIDNLASYTDQLILPDSTYRNWNAFEKKVQGITGPAFMPLCDPQTSGGLLVAVDPSFEKEMRKISGKFSHPIGKIIEKKEYVVKVNENN